MKNAVFTKNLEMWENVDIKFVTTERGRNYLLSEPNFHTKKFIKLDFEWN